MGLLSKFLQLFGAGISKRESHRFDTSKLQHLFLIIGGVPYQVQDISLGGISIMLEKADTEMTVGKSFPAELRFHDESVGVEVEMLRLDENRLSGKITSDLEDYKLFLQKHLSYLIPEQF
jgi:hypothetical protein